VGRGESRWGLWRQGRPWTEAAWREEGLGGAEKQADPKLYYTTAEYRICDRTTRWSTENVVSSFRCSHFRSSLRETSEMGCASVLSWRLAGRLRNELELWRRKGAQRSYDVWDCGDLCEGCFVHLWPPLTAPCVHLRRWLESYPLATRPLRATP
jgi:hypothetical protein